MASRRSSSLTTAQRRRPRHRPLSPASRSRASQEPAALTEQVAKSAASDDVIIYVAEDPYD
eukprot:11711431-Prorocentrum_lima.AAC.1